tara:strand:+ start:592 stop:1245 length:654 start_codon:yes stop_codon:yes gene_type:complete
MPANYIYYLKKNYIYKAYLLSLFVFFPIFGQGIDHSEKIVIKKKPFGLNLSGEIDYRTNKTGLFYRHYDAGISFAFAESWSLAVQYRNIYVQKNGQWILEKRPHAQIQKTINTDAIKWTIKSRQEYRIRDGKDDALRNRFRVKGKSNKRFFSLKPFFGNEFFYDMEKNSYNKNRFSFGFDLPAISIGVPTIFYKYDQALSDNKWVNSFSGLVFQITL